LLRDIIRCMAGHRLEKEYTSVKDVFACWEDVANKIHTAAKAFLFFDLDGTLAPIAARPEMVALDARTKASLGRISRNKKYVVGIISGRGIEDVRRLAGIDGIIYAGNHGLEVKGPGIEYVHPAAIESRRLMEGLARTLARGLREIAGASVEDKTYSLSVHYRLCAGDDAARVKDAVDGAIAPYRAKKQLRATSGKKVLEIRPHADWNKGRVVEWIVGRCAPVARKGDVVWYIGDDLTDEDAFKAVNAMGGITVLAGGGNPLSEAEYVLAKREDMPALLSKLEAI